MSEARLESLQEVLKSVSRKPGLIIGPDATQVPGVMDTILSDAFRGIDIPGHSKEVERETYRAALDSIRQSGPQRAETVEASIVDALKRLPMSLDLPHLAKAGWSACISLTEDVLFETALRNYLAR